MSRRRWLVAGAAVAAYLLAVVVSNLVTDPASGTLSRSSARSSFVETPVFDRDGVVAGGATTRIHLEHARAEAENPRPTAVLIHGSPGGLGSFGPLAPLLRDAGYDTLAIDLAGFGRSDADVPDYGSRAQARYVLAVMDELGVDRAHAAGFSLGGAVAMHMADMRPQAVATVTLLASVGLQETEGSGSHLLEQARYRIATIGPSLLPHFGAIDVSDRSLAWALYFCHTDQRLLGPIMRALETPTLILHGRSDPLVTHHAAERHHAVMPSARLVMTDLAGSDLAPIGHFLPFLQPERSAPILTGFFARHDEPGVRPLTHVSDLVPARDRGLLTPALRGLWSLPWWAVLLGFALLARWSPTTAIVLGGLGKATLSLDFGLTALAVTLGRLSARAPDGLKRPAARVLQRLLWPTPLLLISTLGWVAIEFAFEDARVGPLTLVAATVFAVLLVLGVRRLTRLWSRRPIAFGAVLVALVASHIVALAVPDRAWLMPADAVRATTEIPLGPTADLTRARSARLSYLAWPTAGPSERPPVVLLHGSPGLATDWSNLGPLLEAQGRDVYALDLPGFGLSEAWLHDYSARTYAEIVLAWMDARGIRRAHLVGWSNSGNLVIHAADLAPERLASITMLAATGPQETEGSGVRAFEHAKYLVGYLGVVALPEVVPPLQNAFPRAWRHAFIRNFIDTDQRLAGPIMRRIETPTLVLQGRADFLLADWAAEQHHEVLPASRLVVTADGHMMPFLNPGNVAAALAPFLERHDPPGVAALTHTSDLAPRPDRGVLDQLLRAVRDAPWWIPIPVLFVLAWLRPETTTAIAAVFTSAMSLDFGVAFCGLLPARLLRARRPWEPAGRTRLEDLAWTPIALLIAQPLSAVGPVYDAAGLLGVVAQIAAVTPIALLIAQPLSAVGPVYDAAGLLGVVAQVAAVTLALHLARRAVTREGRQRIRAGFVRTVSHEWWPTWTFYLPITPVIIARALKHRSLLLPTAINPGMPAGGGVVGESKSEIIRAMDHPAVLACALFEPGDAPGALAALRDRPELAGLPIICKPDAGERGRGVRLVRSEADVGRHARHADAPFVLQRFHAGPEECGIMWARSLAPADALTGRITGVVRKTFPVVVGDGERTLRRLIMEHPRYRLQRDLFFGRFAGRLAEIVPEGERVPLGHAGNHSQGCLFTDGADLITPELEAAIDEIARGFEGGLDLGRFDVRYETDEKLRRGEGLAIVELNGLTSEPTQMYDPAWSAARMWRELADHWRTAYELGAWRRERGGRPMKLGALSRLLFGR